jgi:hypothetical protein
MGSNLTSSPTTLNVGIGTAAPTARLEVAGGAVALNDGMLRLRTGTDVNHGLLYSAAVDGVEFRGFTGFRWTTGTSGATERMRLDGAGNLGLGRTAEPAYRLDVNGVVRAVNFVSASDARLKQDIAPVPDLLDRLSRLRVVSFTWRPGAPDTAAAGRRDVGVIAQEVAAAFPELVVGGQGADAPLAVDYGRLAALAVGGVNALRAEKDARIAELEQRLVTQTDRVGALEARLDALEQRLAEPVRSASAPQGGLLPKAALLGLVAVGLALVRRVPGRPRL